MISNKNKLLLGAVALGVSSFAFANGGGLGPVAAPAASHYQPGPYVGVQGGWAQVHEGNGLKDNINKLYDNPALGLEEPTLPSSSVASSKTYYTQNVNYRSKDTDEHHWGGRIFVGYNFNPYFSLESGYSLLPTNTYQFRGGYLSYSNYDSEGRRYSYHISNTHRFRDFEVQSYAVDLMGKAILPLDIMSPSLTGWDIYGKLGVAYVRANYSVVDLVHRSYVPEAELSDQYYRYTKNFKADALRPAYGLGISYNFTDCFGVDLSWLGIAGKDKIGGPHYLDYMVPNYGPPQSDAGDPASQIRSRNAIPTVNMIMLGVTYKF